VPKTAGQSIEKVFLRELGLRWRHRDRLLLRHNHDEKLGPPRLSHLVAQDYVRCAHLSAELFAAYFTFAFIRNPWDRALSMYKYKYLDEPDRPPKRSFSHFVNRRLKGRLWRERYWWVRPQADYLCDDADTVLVDFVGRFETLEESFAVVSKRLGLSVDHLPKENESNKPAVPHYVDWYDDRSAHTIATLYARDVDLFGYEFA
jgi:hypothetical protein